MVNRDNLNLNEFDCSKNIKIQLKNSQEIAQLWHNLLIQQKMQRTNLNFAENPNKMQFNTPFITQLLKFIAFVM